MIAFHSVFAYDILLREDAKCSNMNFKIRGHGWQPDSVSDREKRWMHPEENGLPGFLCCGRNHVRCMKQCNAGHYI